MPTATDDDLRLLFLDARTHRHWREEPVDDALLQRVYDLARMGPTSSNTQPLRVVFVKSAEAKERLRPALAAGNVDQTLRAPATAIIAWDTEFYERMDRLAPHSAGARDRMAKTPEAERERTALVSATLQGGYLILAARALGLDCGPMGGFDNAKVDAAFFPDGKWRSIFLLNLGHGDPSRLHPRSPRLDFAEACRVE